MKVETPRRVLMTTDSVGGVWNHSLQLASALAVRGVRVGLASMGAPLSQAQRAQVSALPAGIEMHESSWRLEWMEDPWDDVRRAGEWLLCLARELQPDVVHLNQFAFGALAFGSPVLVVAHSCVASWWRAVHGHAAPPCWDAYRAAVGRGLAGAQLIAAPTQAMLRALIREHPVAGGCPTMVLPNGRDAGGFEANEKEPVVLAAGRMWDEAKNLAALTAVAPCLPWSVWIAGALSPPHAIDASPRAAVAGGLLTLGELGQDAMGARFARAAIYALPARYEPFGLSILEAGLARCALVLGDIASLRETWGSAALYVPPNSQEALRLALMQLIDDAPLRQEMGKRAQARAARFSDQRMVRAYLAAYARLKEPVGRAFLSGDEGLEEISCVS